ncbi:TetR/AcrR family transcriptional regulator C-terminal domain-containing protein [Arthrobacter sp. JCM 19049]|uniref:TetR/AcrR family transcriptional regulator C-terminal domain-containing protein n=1 Tax=Arthrobacter sp. JCM 19049 TaxID=1460643 RepID=UPI000A997AC4|nr:TetR/AcrR family transcriptional regulator C-terminal domain-containing protein [Arthrobacter sp. JCM 19049]
MSRLYHESAAASQQSYGQAGARFGDSLPDPASAVELFARFAPEDVTVSRIATHAGVYPNQITHHSGPRTGSTWTPRSRCCCGIRRACGPLPAGLQSAVICDRPGPHRTGRALHPDGVTALGMGRANTSVQPSLVAGMKVLFRQSTRYVETVLEDKAWHMPKSVEKEVRTFWSTVFGAVLLSQAGFQGVPSDLDVAAMVSINRN